MGVYIIRPKTTSVARSPKLASRKLTPESRPSQVAEVREQRDFVRLASGRAIPTVS